MDKYKKINVEMVVAFLTLGLVSYWYLNEMCTLAQCYNGAYAVVFQTISIAFVVHGIIFLLLPQGYFRVWLITVASWTLPLSAWVAHNPLTLGTAFRLNMMEAVKLMTYFVSAITALFIFVRFVWLFMQARKQDRIV